MAPKIPAVKNHTEKQTTYASLMKRYKEAMSQGFYLEAIMIDYAALEDRLLALLRCLDVAERSENGPVLNSYFCENVKSLLGFKQNGPIKIDKISTKITLIRKVCKLSEEDLTTVSDDHSRLWLKSAHHSLCDIHKKLNLLETLSAITKWTKVRDEFVHALLNKNHDAIQEYMTSCAKEGYSLYRAMDKIVQQVRHNLRASEQSP